MPFRSWFAALILLVAGFVPAYAAPAESRVNVGDGVEIRVLRAGHTNDRTPTILVPGWGMSADVWSALVERFGRDRTVIAIDPRS